MFNRFRLAQLRSKSTLPALPKQRRDGAILYPDWSKKVIMVTPLVIGGILAASYNLSEDLEPAYKPAEFEGSFHIRDFLKVFLYLLKILSFLVKTIKELVQRGLYTSGSLLLLAPTAMIILRSRTYWLYQNKIQYLSFLSGTTAYFTVRK